MTMEHIYYTSGDQVYKQIVARRNSMAHEMASLILNGETGDELIEAAASYNSLNMLIDSVEDTEIKKADSVQAAD